MKIRELLIFKFFKAFLRTDKHECSRDIRKLKGQLFFEQSNKRVMVALQFCVLCLAGFKPSSHQRVYYSLLSLPPFLHLRFILR